MELQKELPSDNVSGSVAGDVELLQVRFDDDKGSKYAMTAYCCFYSWVSHCVLLPFAPCIMYCGHKEFKAQRCVVDDRRIHYQGGWISRVEKTVPLDRVQDLQIQEGCVQRMCGVSSVLVQTAGGGGGGGGDKARAEITLFSPLQARELRAQIIQRRDAIVLGTTRAAGAGVDGVLSQRTAVTSQPQGVNTDILNELQQLRKAVDHIDKLVETALANQRT